MNGYERSLTTCVFLVIMHFLRNWEESATSLYAHYALLWGYMVFLIASGPGDLILFLLDRLVPPVHRYMVKLDCYPLEFGPGMYKYEGTDGPAQGDGQDFRTEACAGACELSPDELSDPGGVNASQAAGLTDIDIATHRSSAAWETAMPQQSTANLERSFSPAPVPEADLNSTDLRWGSPTHNTHLNQPVGPGPCGM